MLRLLFLFAGLSMFLGSAHAKTKNDAVTDFNTFSKPGEHVGMMRLDDQNRRFIIYTPDGGDFDHPRPVVFFFHGAGGFAEQAAETYGWVEKARKEHFFVVFPEGLAVQPGAAPSFQLNPRVWRDGRVSDSGLVDDANFFSVLLDRLEVVLPIDKRRVYVTGFSNGAGMAFTLGARFSERIAAIAPVASQSFTQIERLARPLPVYYIVGTADPLIPYEGGTTTIWSLTRYTPPVRQSVDQWARLDGCPPVPKTISDQDGVKVVRYGPGRAGSEVVYTVVEGNGHHWPTSVDPLPPAISGPARDPFSATDRIWEFFAKHSLPQ